MAIRPERVVGEFDNHRSMIGEVSVVQTRTVWGDNQASIGEKSALLQERQARADHGVDRDAIGVQKVDKLLLVG